MRRALLLAVGLPLVVGLASCGSGDGESDDAPSAVSYGSPISQPSFGRLIAAVRRDSGGTQVVSLTGYVRGFGEYDVQVGGAHARRITYDYTYAKLEQTASYPYGDSTALTFDLTTLDLPTIEKLHHRAWDDADRRIASTTLTITGSDRPGGGTVHVLVTGVDDSTYHLDALLDGKVIDEGPGDGPSPGAD